MLSAKKRRQLLGEITALMMKSSLHSEYRICDMVTLVLPAIENNQYRLYYNAKKQPVGYVSWAKLSDDIFDAYKNQTCFLKPSDWQSGKNLMFIDFIAPFGHAKTMIQELRITIFPNDVGHFLRYTAVGKFKRVGRLKGVQYR